MLDAFMLLLFNFAEASFECSKNGKMMRARFYFMLLNKLFRKNSIRFCDGQSSHHKFMNLRVERKRRTGES